jgi:hypothetical protein
LKRVGRRREGRGLTTPFWIRVTWTTIHYFEDNRGRIPFLANFVICSIVLGLDELEAFAAGKIIIQIARKGRPELEIHDQLKPRAL